RATRNHVIAGCRPESWRPCFRGTIREEDEMLDCDGAATTSPEAEVVLASYGLYPEAEKAVDTLSDRAFPVDHVKIVARDVVVVEQVLGRFDYARAALYGASVVALLALV